MINGIAFYLIMVQRILLFRKIEYEMHMLYLNTIPADYVDYKWAFCILEHKIHLLCFALLCFAFLCFTIFYMNPFYMNGPLIDINDLVKGTEQMQDVKLNANGGWYGFDMAGKIRDMHENGYRTPKYLLTELARNGPGKWYFKYAQLIDTVGSESEAAKIAYDNMGQRGRFEELHDKNKGAFETLWEDERLQTVGAIFYRMKNLLEQVGVVDGVSEEEIAGRFGRVSGIFFEAQKIMWYVARTHRFPDGFQVPEVITSIAENKYIDEELKKRGITFSKYTDELNARLAGVSLLNGHKNNIARDGRVNIARDGRVNIARDGRVNIAPVGQVNIPPIGGRIERPAEGRVNHIYKSKTHTRRRKTRSRRYR